MVPALAAKRRVLRYDTRGAGLSEKIRGALSIDTMTDDLVALLDALGITEKVALAGIAVGGAIALHTAFRLPERVAAVIVTSPATSIPPANRAAVLARVDAVRARGPARRGRCDRRQRLSGRAARRRGSASPASARAGSPTIRSASRRSTGCSPTWTCTPELAAITCPVLVIGGEFDRGRPPSRGRADRRGDPGREVQGAAQRALRGRADAGADARGRSSEFLSARRGAYTVAAVPRITVACDDSTPPLPCTIAMSCSFTCRAPHSPRSWRTPRSG